MKLLFLIFLIQAIISFQGVQGQQEFYYLCRFQVNIDQQTNFLQVVDLATKQNIFFQSPQGQSDWIQLLSLQTNDKVIDKGQFNLKYTESGYSSGLRFTDITSSFSSLVIEWEVQNSQSQTVQGQLSFNCSNSKTESFQYQISVNQNVTGSNSLKISYYTPEQEQIYGLGIQYSIWNLKGYVIPILTTEQGIGRGVQPLTAILNFAQKAGGNILTTYSSKPIYITSQSRGFMTFEPRLQIFNLTDKTVVQLTVNSLNFSGVILKASSPLETISQITEFTGRMRQHPTWALDGCILGIEGGMDFVRNHTNSLLQLGLKISALWIQDWSGMNKGLLADTVRWNWELDENYYPGWKEQFQQWNIKPLVYINHFLQKLNKEDQKKVKHNYFEIAKQNGYFVKDSKGKVITENNLIKTYAMIDFTNPEAVQFYKDIIVNNVLEGAGSYGYMCDFGEYIPFDAVMYDGTPGSTYHNIYPQRWSQVSREATDSVNISQEIFTFSRSAWIESPKYVLSFWLGDQLESWDHFDGMQSVIYGHFSSGVIGHSMVHSDIAGYTVVNIPPIFKYIRTKELMFRWIEFSCFADSVMRTHPGSSPDQNWQIWSDEETGIFFKKFVDIHVVMKPYLTNLMQLAENYGYPMTRHMFLNYPNSTESLEIVDQFMLGTDILMAPIFKPQLSKAEVVIPPGETWINIWTQKKITGDDGWGKITVSAQIGSPAVYCKKGTQVCDDLTKFISSL